MSGSASSAGQQLKKRLLSRFSAETRANFLVKTWALLKVPMLAFVGPEVREIHERRCVVRIRLGYRTQNHLRSMYFGVLAAGADCVAGLVAMREIQERELPLSLVFKSFRADFVRRADSDVDFVCEAIPEVLALVERALASPDRQECAVPVVAYGAEPGATSREPGRSEAAVVARFELVLSLKRRAS